MESLESASRICHPAFNSGYILNRVQNDNLMGYTYSMSKKFLIIDSFALIFRAYYAYPDSLTDKEGNPINAAYGFTSLLLDTLIKFKPEYVVAVFDPQTPIIRQSEYVLYKANRKETDPELKAQIPKVKEILEAFDIPVLRVDGYEADDVIGTLVENHKKDDLDKILVTGDQDIFQLIDDRTQVYLAGRRFSESKLFDADGVFEKLGITPGQVPHYKGLAGDSSDNIPGVKGIGAKSAVDLIQKFGTIENVYNNIEEVATRQKNKLAENYDMAIKSLSLATIERNVPLSFKIEQAAIETIPFGEVTELFEELRFKSLQKKLSTLKDELGLEEEIGLFASVDEQAPKSSIEVKNLDLAKLKSAKTIFILGVNSEEGHFKKGEKLSKILITLEGSEDVFEATNIDEFKKSIDWKNVKVVSVNIKDLAEELGADGLLISDYQDLGFAVRILSQGVNGYDVEAVLEHSGVRFTDDLAAAVSEFGQIFDALTKQFEQEKKMFNVYRMELKIIPVILEMERRGIILDVQKVEEFEEEFALKKNEIELEIFGLVGHEFNINSPKQVGEVLFGERDLPGGKKTKTGAYSTNEKVLSKLKGVDPVVEQILNYREIDKILSTYLKALPRYVKDDGRIHGTFDQMGAVSGRFSSKDPNLQNIPTGETAGINMRSSFISDKDSEFIAFDYSQQELRILAALSDEETLIQAFNDNLDIHSVTAAGLFGKDVGAVSPEERSFGKTLNFSIVYGISAFGLSERLNIGRAEASDLIDRFYERYPGIKGYFETQRQNLVAKGFAETVMGRRRSADPLRVANRFAKQAIERELLNFAIQGSAADLMKMAMVMMEPELKSLKASLLLQIHDEFLFEFYGNATEKTEFIEKVKSIMENVVDIGVGYRVDVKAGQNWGEMAELPLNNG